jgi:AraC-like DNA-binding protein
MSNDLRELIARHCRHPHTPTAIPRLALSRPAATAVLAPGVVTPLLCVLASGRKRLVLGREEYRYDADNYLIASADLPVRGQIVVAPCLALTLAIEPTVVADVLLSLPPVQTVQPTPLALAVNRLDADLTGALERLLHLLDRPADIPVLAAQIEREIVYRLLCGAQGEMLRQLALPTSNISLIGRAIGIIRARYDEKLRIEELARTAGMSVTTFHRHFRAVTAMSPLQFQKRIRLYEARRMLFTHDVDAGNVSLDVGYVSASQFNREYRRLFGEPPGRDAAQVRKEPAKP